MNKQVSVTIFFFFFKGGLQASDLIDHSLIDHFVPFLPLERSHVEQCIKAELEKYSVNYDKDIIQLVYIN